MRAFVGCFPPPTIQRAYADAAIAWAPTSGARIVDAANIHLTLAFLGEQPPELVDELQGALDVHVGSLAAFEVHAGGVTGFPSAARARVGVVELVGAPLTSLARAVADAVRAVGIEPEDRQFRPHATVVRSRLAFRVPAVQAPAEAWPIDEVCIVESHLGPEGARYEILGRVGLGRSAGSAGSARP